MSPELGRHVVERAGQLADFIVGGREQPGVQFALRHLLGGLDQIVQRPGSAVGDPDRQQGRQHSSRSGSTPQGALQQS